MTRKVFAEIFPFCTRTSFQILKRVACVPGKNIPAYGDPSSFFQAGGRARNSFGIGRCGTVPRFKNSLGRFSQLSSQKKKA